MSHAPFKLDTDARAVVERTIRSHCSHRGWELRALNVRTTHLHVVVKCPDARGPERVMSELKAWTTRRLREAGLVDASRKVWTEHGSTRWINDPVSLGSAIDYVMRLQDEKFET